MPDFNVCDAFRIFDEEEIGLLTPQDFQNGLSDLAVIISSEQLSLFFKEFDKNGDG